MGFDLGHTISSVSKLALRTKRRIDKNNESNIKVYELWLDHTYRTYETLTKDGYRTYEFEGKKVENRKFDLIYPSKYKDEIDKTIGDVFSITPSSYIMNEKAYKILYPYLKSHSQIFKINNNGTIFYVINVTDLIDCLDYDNSEIKRFPSSGRIYGVIGGFHLFDVNERLEKTIDYLKENNIELLYPCHCVSLKAKIQMSKKLDINEVGVGLELKI